MLPYTLGNLFVPLVVSAVRLEASAAWRDGTLGQDTKIGLTTAPELHATERWTSVVRTNRGSTFKMQTRARSRIPEMLPRSPRFAASGRLPTRPSQTPVGRDMTEVKTTRQDTLPTHPINQPSREAPGWDTSTARATIRVLSIRSLALKDTSGQTANHRNKLFVCPPARSGPQ